MSSNAADEGDVLFRSSNKEGRCLLLVTCALFLFMTHGTVNAIVSGYGVPLLLGH